ncbi:zeta toxin family protein [Candidatus Enterococcus courvalinii]|uniref:UDP-N-acetylglucosamine kinase n=1 Tax=Candidatus Enterococcus courvalinii TaxID=2815329 RepID=A0ABS3HYN3_9ENTE|nr:zeta toxin family protein [Enterococcus sp. MSG2901]MBO0481536.1 zeta toxin family protein [Enterococcus sp. MSG2901]
MVNKELHYVVVGGVNGAGKSTIYEFDTVVIDGLKTDRINADEILKRNGGDWRNSTDVAKSMRQVVTEIKKHFEDRESFHHETTFAGNTRPHEKRLLKAKDLGYDTTLIYVGLNSPELAIKRVDQRVNEGGHGVDEALVRERYQKSIENLSKLEKYFDNIKLYDNSDYFEPIYAKDDHVVSMNKTKKYNWVPENIKEKSVEQPIEKEIVDEYSRYENGYEKLEKDYSAKQGTLKIFQDKEYVSKFYNRHKNEIDERVFDLSSSIGVNVDDLLGDSPKQKASELAYKMCLGNVLDKFEEKDILSEVRNRDWKKEWDRDIE